MPKEQSSDTLQCMLLSVFDHMPDQLILAKEHIVSAVIHGIGRTSNERMCLLTILQPLHNLMMTSVNLLPLSALRKISATLAEHGSVFEDTWLSDFHDSCNSARLAPQIL